MLCTTVANSAQLGPYIGAEAGKSSARTPDSAPFIVSAAGSNTITRNGWAERAFAGYNLNKFFGLEVGYTNYARVVYNGRIPGAHAEMQYNFRTYDLVGKAYFPLGYTGYNLYALAGAARVTEALNYKNPGIPLSGSIAGPAIGTSNVYKTRPMYGLGINFSMPQYHFTISLEATQIIHLGGFTTNPNALPNLNLATLGIAYNFC